MWTYNFRVFSNHFFVINFDNCDISDKDVSIRDEEKCCVCGDFEPKALRDKPYNHTVGMFLSEWKKSEK
jgi:hypothetical protein